MRSLLVTLSALFLAPLSHAQWSTQSPSPTSLDVRGVAAPTADRIFVVTANGVFDDVGSLFESPDGGASWVPRDVPFSLNEPLNGITFYDAERGWVFGNRNYRTTDGGDTWAELPVLGSVYQMAFFTPSFGMASSGTTVWESLDGGDSWELSPDTLRAYAFRDDAVGLGAASTRVSGNGLYRTTDGGQTFEFVYGGLARSVAFLSDEVAVALIDDQIVRSEDGGLAWAPVAPTSGHNRFRVVSPDVVLAWRHMVPGGTVLRSADGGQTWSDLGAVLPDGVRALVAADAQAVVAMNPSGDLYHSADAGANWALVYETPGAMPSFLATAEPSFPTSQVGYLGYGEGFVLKTTDGGASWAQVSSGTGAGLTDVQRFPDGRLIAVGEGGTVVARDGTAPWALLPTPAAPAELVGVDVVVDGTVVVLDRSGRVYRSADGGETWVAGATDAPTTNAADLHFVTGLEGWVNGISAAGNSVWHTTDGGDTWTPASGVVGSHSALAGAGDRLWSMISSGRIYRSFDAGTTWAFVDLPGNPFQVSDVEFATEAVGYAVAHNGYAARSADGGVTWDVLPTPSVTHDFTDLYVVSPDELWIATNGDALYYSDSGGQGWTVMERGTDVAFRAVAASPGGDAWAVGYDGAIEHFAGPPGPPLNQPPVASYTFSALGLEVAFTDTSVDPDGTVADWLWDFGDGTTSEQPNPVHTFPGPDTYHVLLTVTDDDGATGKHLKFVAVSPGPGGTFGGFTEVTPLDPLFVTPQDEDFVVATTAPADYDGDGDLDIAVFGYYVWYGTGVEYRLVLLRNDGELGAETWAFGTVDVPLGNLTSGASDLAWGDPDGDGDLDLLVGSNGLSVLYRNDAGVLSATETVLPGYSEDNLQADFDLQSISWADVDNDGDEDLLMPSVFDPAAFEHRTVLLRNDGADGAGGWVFTEVDAPFGVTSHAQSAWADDDGDGDLDLLLVHLEPNTGNGYIRIYLNDGDGAWTETMPLGGLYVEHGEVEWGDLDADGDLDLLVVGDVRTEAGAIEEMVRVYRKEGSGYTPTDLVACVPCEGWIDLNAAAWGDYDSDGDLDVLVAGTHNTGQIEGRARLYTNDGGAFTESGDDLPAPRSSGSSGGAFSWFDLDADGDLDYFISGYYFVPGGNGLVEAQMHAYRNDSEGSNAEPQPPMDLVAEVTGATLRTSDNAGALYSVAFSWSPAADDSTPTAAITYDLDLVQTGVPVSTPRRIPEPGNVSAATAWQLDGLAEGTYTWTVRAVDSAFNGSEPAQGTFTVGGGGPGAFLEADGQVVFEGEHADFNTPRGDHSWVESVAPAGSSGEAAMVSTPDIGARIRRPEGASPELAYAVEFSTTGSYYVWLRVWAPDANGRLVYAGVDGAVQHGLLADTTQAWTWINVGRRADPASFDVTTPGEHTVHVWMGEDGLVVDKVVLSTEASFTPTGLGPDESPRSGEEPIALSGTARFDGRAWRVDLTWSPSDGGLVDVYRDGVVVRTTDDDGTYTDTLPRTPKESYGYRVCETDSGDCSDTVTVAIGAVAAAQATTARPVAFALDDAFPNPFGRETTVPIAVPEVAFVRVSVYDALGRRVALLADGPMEVGNHRLRWQAAELPSGTYFVRMEAGSFAATQRVTLLR